MHSSGSGQQVAELAKDELLVFTDSRLYLRIEVDCTRQNRIEVDCTLQKIIAVDCTLQKRSRGVQGINCASPGIFWLYLILYIVNCTLQNRSRTYTRYKLYFNGHILAVPNFVNDQLYHTE